MAYGLPRRPKQRQGDTRERMENRAEKRADWAESRETKRDAAWEESHRIANSIPLGQPILVGHHSERGHRAAIAKIDRKGFEGLDHHRMAERHNQVAAELDRQLERSIFDDDHDACERLQEKIDDLEAQRTSIEELEHQDTGRH